jgi:uncharacterized membrane protein YfcA
MDIIGFNLTFLIVLFIFLLGGIVKGTIGVGLPTITLVLLSFLFDIKDSISFILIPIIFSNLIQLMDGKNLLSILKQTKYFLFSSILDSKIILLILAFLLISNSLLVLANKIITLKHYNSFWMQSFIGSLNGLATGLSSIYTMPMIFLIQSLKFEKDKLIQFMGLTFFLYSIVQITLFTSFDMMNEKALLFSSFACVPILLGLFIGRFLRKIVSEKLFKTLFNYMLLIMGLVILIKNLF